VKDTDTQLDTCRKFGALCWWAKIPWFLVEGLERVTLLCSKVTCKLSDKDNKPPCDVTVAVVTVKS